MYTYLMKFLVFSNLFDTGSVNTMAPNSEESRRIATFQWGEETLTKVSYQLVETIRPFNVIDNF